MLSKDKGTKEERIKKELQNNSKLTKNDNKYVPFNNYFQCKWTKSSNQKIQNG